ncbi:hypothetical protein [Actinomycetospora straminea]|uniref:Uncharacterized protein n=1 Tax=Actinomycetospora straminea TaxID=663607 RepID=A0ABP9ESV2_9PSEU|nr:hypothetical protein [Actinomycetospora straminea]MDD7931514.1 hypothetical protein [Actinomycetospora straminea]
MAHPAPHLTRRAHAGAVAVPADELPGDPGSLRRDVLAVVGEHRARLARLALHLVVAALPLLAISAHVFGLAPMNVTGGLFVVPLTLLVLVLGVFAPVGEDRIVLTGAGWGVVATLVYDAVRLDTVYLLGWWGDFIPTVGTWILGDTGGATATGAIVGYLWRYVGDGGGIGVTFFLLVAANGLRRWGERATVAAAVAFAVFPVWTGLVATVAIAPRGERLMFPLTPTTVALSLLGHLVFGLVLGLGCARCRGLEERWPWPALLDRPWAGPTGAPARPDDGWGPADLVVARSAGRSGVSLPGRARAAVPEAPGEVTEIVVERPIARPGWSPTPRSARAGDDPPSGPLPVGRRDGSSATAWAEAWQRSSVGPPLRPPLGPAPGPPRREAVGRASGPASVGQPVGQLAGEPAGRPVGGPAAGSRPVGPPSGPVPVEPPSGSVPPSRERDPGPVQVFGTPSAPVPLWGAGGPRAPRAAGWPSGSAPADRRAEAWGLAVPPEHADPWLGGPREVPGTSSAKPHPTSATRR